ncbi:hypothetical protein AA994_06420, partial [Campylobacter vulpis]
YISLTFALKQLIHKIYQNIFCKISCILKTYILFFKFLQDKFINTILLKIININILLIKFFNDKISQNCPILTFPFYY